jgi:hypothetical protein
MISPCDLGRAEAWYVCAAGDEGRHLIRFRLRRHEGRSQRRQATQQGDCTGSRHVQHPSFWSGIVQITVQVWANALDAGNEIGLHETRPRPLARAVLRRTIVDCQHPYRDSEHAHASHNSSRPANRFFPDGRPLGPRLLLQLSLLPRRSYAGETTCIRFQPVIASG